MSKTLTRETIADKAAIHSETVLEQAAKIDRSFELPRGLYVVMAICYLGFLVIMTLAVASPGLIVPMGAIVAFIGMFFAVPGMMLRQTPKADKFVKSWGQLMSRGINTNTGRLAGSEAAVQMLILPVLIVGWGLAIAVIIALV